MEAAGEMHYADGAQQSKRRRLAAPRDVGAASEAGAAGAAGAAVLQPASEGPELDGGAQKEEVIRIIQQALADLGQGGGVLV